jgi:hypothetical protein
MNFQGKLSQIIAFQKIRLLFQKPDRKFGMDFKHYRLIFGDLSLGLILKTKNRGVIFETHIFKIQNPKSKIQNPKSKIQNPKSDLNENNLSGWLN